MQRPEKVCFGGRGAYGWGDGRWEYGWGEGGINLLFIYFKPRKPAYSVESPYFLEKRDILLSPTVLFVWADLQ